MKLVNKTEIFGISPEMVIGTLITNSVLSRYGIELIITSGTERSSKHSTTSLHYSGNAIDIRVWYIEDNIRERVVEDLKSSLGHEFDVVDETDHIHIEYQPKAPK